MTVADLSTPALRCDVAVVGAGIVGLALATALGRAGFSVASVGPVPPMQAGRTVALLDGSVRLLKALGVWPAVAASAAPLRAMRLVDDTPSLFKGPPVTFEARSVGLAAFGFNVGNDALVAALGEAAGSVPGLRRDEALADGYAIAGDCAEVRLADGSTLEARLVVAADGARSALREAAGIGSRQDHYPQVALTTVLAHSQPHGDVSTEFHTRRGPFTLVPMPDDDAGAHRSSLVWVMTPDEADRRLEAGPVRLAEGIARQSRGLLGDIAVAGRVGRFPISRTLADRLVGPRLALAGEAAHALPPIGAQGLNLSLRDAATLVDIVSDARAAGQDIGEPAVLDRYARARAGDIALRGAGVHALNLSLLLPWGAVDAARGLGLQALAQWRPLRDAVMRQGLRPSRDEPRLMQVADAEANRTPA